jgi:hypothetical protein
MLTGHSNHTTEAARKSRASTIHFSAVLRLFHKATSLTTQKDSIVNAKRWQAIRIKRILQI